MNTQDTKWHASARGTTPDGTGMVVHLYGANDMDAAKRCALIAAAPRLLAVCKEIAESPVRPGV